MKLKLRMFQLGMLLVVALSACRASPDDPEQASTGAAPPEPFLAEYEASGGWGPVDRMRLRFIGNGDSYRVERTVVEDGYEHETAEVPADFGEGLRDELLAADMLTLTNAPSVSVTDMYAYRYLVVVGDRGNRFRAYAPSSQEDDRYRRIAELLSRCAQRFIDVPAYAQALSHAEPEEVGNILAEMDQDLSWKAMYEAFPPEAFLGENVLTPAVPGHVVDYGTFSKLGVRIGPTMVPKALERLPKTEPRARALLYVLLQAMLMQPPEAPRWHAETARWAERDPDLARRTAGEIREAFTRGPLRSLLLNDLREQSGTSLDLPPHVSAGWLLLTLNDAASIDAVVDSVEANSHREWDDRLSMGYTFHVGTQALADTLLRRATEAEDSAVRRELLDALAEWTYFAAPELPSAGPDDARFTTDVAAKVQPMLTDDSARVRANATQVLLYYVAAVDPAVVEASLLAEKPHVEEDRASPGVALKKIDLLRASGAPGEKRLRNHLDDAVLGDAIAMKLATPEEPDLMRRLCEIARSPGWIDRRYVVRAFNEHDDPRTITMLVWMLGQEEYDSHHRFIAGTLGSITGVWHRDPGSDPPLGVWWRTWWEEHEDEYPAQYRPIEPPSQP